MTSREERPASSRGAGILIVAHDGLAQAFHSVLLHVTGPLERVRSLGISDDDEDPCGSVARAATELDDGSGVVVATDMEGSSPGNRAVEAVGRIGIPVEIVSGVSLPMLISLVENRSFGPAAAAAAARGLEATPVRPHAPPPTQAQPAAERPLTIRNRKGLHARASARLTEVAERFESTVTVSRDGFDADAGSILDLLMLAAAKGSRIQVRAVGPDAVDALAAVAALVESGFGESD